MQRAMKSHSLLMDAGINLSRREFLKLIGISAGAACLSNCTSNAIMTPDTGITMTPSSYEKLPLAMQRGVDKNGWRILGPGGGGAQYIPTIKPDDPNTVLVACDMTGSYLTRDGGRTWKQLNFKVWVGAIAFDPSQPETIYIGATGLYRSKDTGETWDLVFPNPAAVTGEKNIGDHANHSYVCTDNFPGGKVIAICVDPKDSKHLLIGINKDGLRLFRSQDGGEKWTELLTMEGKQVIKSWWGSEDVYFLTDKGFFRLSPSTFRLIALPVPAATTFADFSGGVSAGQEVLYLTSPARWMDETFLSGVYRSMDKGYSWQPCSLGLDSGLAPGMKRNFNRIATCPGDARVVYLSAAEVDENWNPVSLFGTFKSEDMGETWKWVLKIGSDQPANRTPGWIEKDFDTDWGGAPFYLSVAPSDPRVCYATDWGGTHCTTDGGETWEQLYCNIAPDGTVTTRGLDVTNIYWVSFDPHNPAHLVLACTDIGAFHSLNGGQTWKHIMCGVPKAVSNTCYQLVFDPQVKGKAWAIWSDCHDMPRPKMFKSGKSDRYKGTLTVSTDGLESWQVSAKGLPSTGVPTDLILDYHSPAGSRTLYTAIVGKGVYKSEDDGRTWAAKNNGITGNRNAWRLIQLPDGTLYLLVCRGLENDKEIDGGMYVSHNGAETWQRASLPEGVNFPNDLCIDPQNPKRMYLAAWPTTIDGAEVHGGLYRTEDGGATWTNIFDQSSHVYGVTVDKRHPATVIVTNFEGMVMRSDDCGESWNRLEGFTFKWAKQPILDPYNPGMLYVTTFGSSLWYGSAQGSNEKSSY